MQRVAFGEYKPDLPLLMNDGLSVAKNVVPVQGGYDQVLGLSDLSVFGVLGERPRGSIAGIDARGNPFNFAGSETKLYMLRNEEGTVDASRVAGGAYNCTGQNVWEFEMFGREVIACNPNDETQSLTVGVDSKFVQLGNPDLTATVAPRAKTMAVVGTILVLGNTYDRINGRDESALHWSAVNDPFNWPAPGTEVARAVQSDRQPLSGNGGAIQRVISGAEVGAVFLENQITRMDYRGGDVVFELNDVESRRGLLIPNVCVPFGGRRVLFLAEDGFYLFDYTRSESVGRERVDRTFLSDIDLSLLHRVSAVSDPDSQRIWILYPGTGHVAAGTPNKVLVYDWGLNRWAGPIDITAEWITHVVDSGVSLDSAHAPPDDPDTDGVDGAGLGSFDERVASPGDVKLGAYSSTFQIQDFSGAALAATLESGRRELNPGSRSLCSGARPLVDAVDPSVQCAAISRTNAIPRYSKASKTDEDGESNFLVDGRYHVFRTYLPSGFRHALGLDVDARMSGRW